MPCDDCGAPCQGSYCEQCEQIRLNERIHGDRVDGTTWAIDQQGLGDADPEGQSTLDGGIRPSGGGE